MRRNSSWLTTPHVSIECLAATSKLPFNICQSSRPPSQAGTPHRFRGSRTPASVRDTDRCVLPIRRASNSDGFMLFFTKMPTGCIHLEKYKQGEGTRIFRMVHAIFVVRATAEARRTKVENAYCYVCKRSGPHIHACLQCVFFGCHRHIRDHGKMHDITMELAYGQIHCAACGDYVYDTELDNVAFDNKIKAGVCRRRLFQWTAWDPKPDERELLENQTKVIYITPESTVGLRGLLNLGSTCFMNCIIQALMHTPLLRDYFLSERHTCKVKEGCLVCELSHLFQEFYKGTGGPLSLHNFLYLIWTHAKHLAGYEQQDAHEFFMATLNLLHQHCADMLPNMRKYVNSEDGRKCNCIIDQIFSGGLQSELVCQKCNRISPTVDPTKDFSLELLPPTAGGKPPATLTECLERFTRAEHLGSSAMCSYCKSYQETTKQLTLKSLPIVISIHLKRFQHSKQMAKVSTSISFPEILDMTPFMSRSETSYPVPSDNRYSLFAVINHGGNSINGGHYTAYVRQQKDHWYKCDDYHITRATLREVLDSEGYMLFYHKHVLEYD